VHTAALFPRDVQLRYDIAPEVARVVRVQEISVTGGHEDKPQIVREPHGGQVLTLAHMEPGENLWLGVTLTVMPQTPLGLFFPIRFTEIVNGQAVNGLDVGPRVAPQEVAFHENLLSHASVFRRLAALYSFKQAAVESEDAAKLSRTTLEAEGYLKFVHAHTAAIGVLAEEMIKIGQRGDPFALRPALTRLQTALAANNVLSVDVAHAALLEKLDAFISMVDKAKGDTADVLQNVSWQKSLFARVELPYDVVQQITDSSASFIRAFERHKASAADFPKLVERLLPAYEAAAEKLSAPGLKTLAAEMKNTLRSPQQLQKAHRDYLLVLESYAK